jgi:hypothetical protein
LNPAPQNIDQLRITLHRHMEQTNERHLNAIYVVVESEVPVDASCDAGTLRQLYRRRDAHLKGERRSPPTEESLALVGSNEN